VFKARKIV